MTSLIQKCEDLYHDLTFSTVRKWKKKHHAKAIGFLPVYVPRELIHASGMLPVGLMGGSISVEIIRGDAFFQSYICHIPRSTIELAVSKKLDFLDGILFPAICDVIRNLSGMWKLLFPKTYVKYLDFPQCFGDAGKEFYHKELEGLWHDFKKISGKKRSDIHLKKSIELYNENRRAIEALYDLRSEAPHVVSTTELYLLMRASNVLEVSEHTQMLYDYMKGVVKLKRPKRDYIRVIVTGAFCEQPPLTLIRALENSGCYIVDDDWVLGARYHLRDIEVSKNPLQALVESYFSHTVATASRYEENGTKGDFLVQQVKHRKAEGVIFSAPSFCDPALLERPMLQTTLSKHHIPYTTFKYAENTGQIQVIKEQTGTFSDSIRLWGHA